MNPLGPKIWILKILIINSCVSSRNIHGRICPSYGPSGFQHLSIFVSRKMSHLFSSRARALFEFPNRVVRFSPDYNNIYSIEYLSYRARRHLRLPTMELISQTHCGPLFTIEEEKVTTSIAYYRHHPIVHWNFKHDFFSRIGLLNRPTDRSIAHTSIPSFVLPHRSQKKAHNLFRLLRNKTLFVNSHTHTHTHAHYTNTHMPS